MFTLFNLQGTLGAFDRFRSPFIDVSASAANFDMLSQLFHSVKNFFQILSKFFCDIFASSKAIAYINIRVALCQHLFSQFFNFFENAAAAAGSSRKNTRFPPISRGRGRYLATYMAPPAAMQQALPDHFHVPT